MEFRSLGRKRFESEKPISVATWKMVVGQITDKPTRGTNLGVRNVIRYGKPDEYIVTESAECARGS